MYALQLKRITWQELKEVLLAEQNIKRFLKQSKDNGVEEKILSELHAKLWKKPCNMLIEIEEIKKENLNHCGYKELTLV